MPVFMLAISLLLTTAARRKIPRPARRYAALTQAAEYSNLSVKTLRRYIASGVIHGYRAGVKLIMVDLNELDAVLIRQIETGAGTSDH